MNNAEIEKQIITVLEKIRPFLNRDGGDVEFVRFENGRPRGDFGIHRGVLEKLLVNRRRKSCFFGLFAVLLSLKRAVSAIFVRHRALQ